MRAHIWKSDFFFSSFSLPCSFLLSLSLSTSTFTFVCYIAKHFFIKIQFTRKFAGIQFYMYLSESFYRKAVPIFPFSCKIFVALEKKLIACLRVSLFFFSTFSSIFRFFNGIFLHWKFIQIKLTISILKTTKKKNEKKNCARKDFIFRVVCDLCAMWLLVHKDTVELVGDKCLSL